MTTSNTFNVLIYGNKAWNKYFENYLTGPKHYKLNFSCSLHHNISIHSLIVYKKQQSSIKKFDMPKTRNQVVDEYFNDHDWQLEDDVTLMNFLRLHFYFISALQISISTYIRAILSFKPVISDFDLSNIFSSNQKKYPHVLTYVNNKMYWLKFEYTSHLNKSWNPEYDNEQHMIQYDQHRMCNEPYQ